MDIKRLNTKKLIDWYWDEIYFYKKNKNITKLVGEDNPCQCETEQIIKNSSSPDVIRPFMMVSILTDQMMWTHFKDEYDQFRDTFKYPKLLSHGVAGMASPSWFVYPYHNHDKKINWQVTSDIANILLLDFYKWLKNNVDREKYRNFQILLINEVNTHFDKVSKDKLISIISKIHAELIYL